MSETAALLGLGRRMVTGTDAMQAEKYAAAKNQLKRHLERIEPEDNDDEGNSDEQID